MAYKTKVCYVVVTRFMLQQAGLASVLGNVKCPVPLVVFSAVWVHPP